MLCDQVCILRRGEVVVAGSLRDLLHEGKRRSEVTVTGASEALAADLTATVDSTRRVGDALVMEVAGDAAVQAVLSKILAAGARLQSVTPKRETLEDLFVREAL
jgi:ABC-2 type transport system ATP-binding protein